LVFPDPLGPLARRYGILFVHDIADKKHEMMATAIPHIYVGKKMSGGAHLRHRLLGKQ
jgi:hypothetical protein